MIAKRITDLEPGDCSPATHFQRIVEVQRTLAARYAAMENREIAGQAYVNYFTADHRTFSFISTDQRMTVALTEDEVQPWMITDEELLILRNTAEMLERMVPAFERFTRTLPFDDAAHVLRRLIERVDLTNHITTKKENHHAMD